MRRIVVYEPDREGCRNQAGKRMVLRDRGDRDGYYSQNREGTPGIRLFCHLIFQEMVSFVQMGLDVLISPDDGTDVLAGNSTGNHSWFVTVYDPNLP